MDYHPQPIDTSAVSWPAWLDELVERLAEHTHDTWAVNKMKKGYRYGPRTDDQAKTHRDLLPYVKLPEGTKDLDRATAVGTIKALLALGYRIERP